MRFWLTWALRRNPWAWVSFDSFYEILPHMQACGCCGSCSSLSILSMRFWYLRIERMDGKAMLFRFSLWDSELNGVEKLGFGIINLGAPYSLNESAMENLSVPSSNWTHLSISSPYSCFLALTGLLTLTMVGLRKLITPYIVWLGEKLSLRER